MVDINLLKYRLVLLDEHGAQYDLKDRIQDLGWEDNENELAARITFKVVNGDNASGLFLNGQAVFLLAGTGEEEEEVCRGTLKTRQDNFSLTARQTDVAAYDLLHQLDKSQDNMHIPSGRTTRQIFNEIASNWGIPIGEYRGPDVTHGKMDFKNKTPAGMFLELLDDAKKKGAGEFVIRAAGDTILVLPVMDNQRVYVFRGNNTLELVCKESIADMVTRVKVLGQSKEEGSAPVEAVMDGRVEFGILQKTYTRNSDETIEDAKKSAQEILDEDGCPDMEITLNLPDVPQVRKGDAIYCDHLETADGYYKVLSVSHDCGERTMSVKVKAAAQSLEAQGEGRETGAFTVGSQVAFLGGTHYVSSDSGARGYAVKGSGPAKITKIASGKAHPFHLVHSDGTCNVYGWVDQGTFK